MHNVSARRGCERYYLSLRDPKGGADVYYRYSSFGSRRTKKFPNIVVTICGYVRDMLPVHPLPFKSLLLRPLTVATIVCIPYNSMQSHERRVWAIVVHVALSGALWGLDIGTVRSYVRGGTFSDSTAYHEGQSVPLSR